MIINVDSRSSNKKEVKSNLLDLHEMGGILEDFLRLFDEVNSKEDSSSKEFTTY